MESITRITTLILLLIMDGIRVLDKNEYMPWEFSWKVSEVQNLLEEPFRNYQKAYRALCKQYYIEGKDENGKDISIIPPSKQEEFLKAEELLLSKELMLKLPSFTKDELQEADRQMKDLSKKGIPPAFLKAIKPLVVAAKTEQLK